MPDIEIASSLAGGMLGLLVGDAVGVPYEFRPPGAIGTVEMKGHGSHGQPAGTWSDDGALALALADSLLPAHAVAGDVDVGDQKRGRRILAACGRWNSERHLQGSGVLADEIPLEGGGRGGGKRRCVRCQEGYAQAEWTAKNLLMNDGTMRLPLRWRVEAVSGTLSRMVPRSHLRKSVVCTSLPASCGWSR